MADKNIQMKDKDQNRLMPVTIAKNVLHNETNLELTVVDIENKANEAKQTATDLAVRVSSLENTTIQYSVLP